MADPLGMTGRVGHRHRSTLRDTKDRKAFQAQRLDNRFQVGDPVAEAEIGCLPIG